MSYFASAPDSPSNISNQPLVHEQIVVDNVSDNLFKKCTQYMVLRIFVNGSIALQDLYEKHVAAHNNKVLTQEYVDSGFDLFSPIELNCSRESLCKVDFHIQCAAYTVNPGGKKCHTGYYLYPRSSLSKTPLRLANSVGIIDAGYRGDIIGVFDCNKDKYTVNQFDRLTQICAPNLVPIYVEMVANDLVLGETLRGAGGFGSSGR